MKKGDYVPVAPVFNMSENRRSATLHTVVLLNACVDQGFQSKKALMKGSRLPSMTLSTLPVS